MIFITGFFIRVPSISLGLNILKFFDFEPKNSPYLFVTFSDFEHYYSLVTDTSQLTAKSYYNIIT